MATVRIGATGDRGAAHQLTVAGVFDRPADAETAQRDLRRAGVPPERITVLTRDGLPPGCADARVRIAWPAIGAVAGATVGALSGGLAGVGAAPPLSGIAPVAAEAAGGVAVPALSVALLSALVVGLIGLLAGLTLWRAGAGHAPDARPPGSALLLADAGTAQQASEVQAAPEGERRRKRTA